MPEMPECSNQGTVVAGTSGQTEISNSGQSSSGVDLYIINVDYYQYRQVTQEQNEDDLGHLCTFQHSPHFYVESHIQT